MMDQNYGPATLTEVKTEIKTEPRVNGFNMSLNNMPPTGGPSSSYMPNLGTRPEDDSKDHLPREQICCLKENGRRCGRVAGNASYSKRIQKTVMQRKLKLFEDASANHIYICDHHKDLIQSVRTKRRRKDSEDDSGETDSEHPDVDLYQLQVNTLRRYKKQFKVPSRPGLNKAQLADSLMRHFKTISVSEKETLTYFIYMVKTNKSKLDRERKDDDANF
ncbi:histone deacetylase complex subunit SAP30 homolog [Tigriopus californicus]|uniref:histone deacetylase complex subunit SAP30 homolog n=1 Tax=Tigriopus californicus TaxID=6832 RepID=UPI0027DA6860|nr:histone deacetylase complex subunit SAP30 homolog [Tigriopus californicus]